MKNIFLALVLVLSTAWAPITAHARPKTADGYRFAKKSIELKEVRIKIVTYKSKAQLEKAILQYTKDAKYGAVRTSKVEAFSILQSPDFEVCTIHMIDPAISHKPEYVGHELLHCLYGEWHK